MNPLLCAERGFVTLLFPFLPMPKTNGIISKSGGIAYRYSGIFEYYGAKTPDELREIVRKEELMPADFFRFRNCGNHRAPGKLVLFLFPELKSAAEQKTERVMADLGSGI